MRIKAKFLYLYSRCDRFGQAAPRQPANLFAIAPCLHYVLDRRRFGKMQVDLLLPSVCTIFAFAIANIPSEMKPIIKELMLKPSRSIS